MLVGAAGLALLVSGEARSTPSLSPQLFVALNSTAGNNVGSYDHDGGSANTSFITGGNNVQYIAVGGGYIYWTNINGNTIGRANIDGTGVNQSFISPGTSVSGIAVDGSHIYWSTNTGGTIGRADLDGGNVTTLIGSAGWPTSLAVNGQHLYWINTLGGYISRADLDGSNVSLNWLTPSGGPYALAIDSRHLWWADYNTEAIARANIDGSGVNESFIGGMSHSPTGIAVDSEHVYWTSSNSIGRANVDGTSVNQQLFATCCSFPAFSPSGLALLSVPGAPTNVVAAPGNGVAAVSFDTPDANGSAITGYTVTSSPGGVTASGTSSPIAVTGLTNGTSYTFTVTATNDVGTSAASAASDPATPDQLPHIKSFAPASGVAGTKITLTGTNLAGVTSVTFPGSSTPTTAATIDSTSATKVVVELPDDATYGLITAANGIGSSQSATSFKPLPKITSLSAYDGLIGDEVQIFGTNLSASTVDVKFGSAHTGHTPVSATEIDAPVPPNFSSGKVSVATSPGGTATYGQAFAITKVTAVSPLAAPADKILTIKGQGLGSVTAVDFAGASGVGVHGTPTPTSVQVVVPDDASTGFLTIHTPHVPGGMPVPGTFKPVPTITDVTPLDGKEGTSVTITGKNLLGMESVHFGKVDQPLNTPMSATEIISSIPGGFSSGPVSVTTPGGTGVSTQSVALTEIKSFSPAKAAASSILTIKGQGLGSVSSVVFSGLFLPASLVGTPTPTTIKVLVPAYATDGPITIHSPNIDIGGLQSDDFKPLPSLLPIPLSAQAGAPLLVLGGNLEPTGVPPTVKFGAESLTPGAPSNTGFLIPAIPADAVSTTLTVTTPNGVATVKVLVPPTISTGPSPAEGVTGTPVTLTGKTFTGTKSVRFANGVTTPFKLQGALGSTQTLTFKVPASAASGPITVTNAGGGTATGGSFTVDPEITAFSPAKGPDGATVTLTGSGFGVNGDTRVIKVGDVPATSTKWVSPTKVSFPIPDGAPTTGPISIAVNGGTAADTGEKNLTVTETIASFTPDHGPAGTSVEIDGAGFTDVTGVSFNGVAAASFTADSATVIHATLPAGTSPGPITITRSKAPKTLTSGTNFGTDAAVTGFSPSSGQVGDTIHVTGTDLDGATTVTFGGGATATPTNVTSTSLDVDIPAAAATGTITVTTPLGDAESSGTLTVSAAITGFTPSSGKAGDDIVVSGGDLGGATTVTFGGGATATATSVTATSFHVTVPDTAETGTISVATPAGDAESTDTFTVLPAIASFAPGEAPAGQTVVITGSGFTGATDVTFGGVSAGGGNFNVDSATQITATVPADAATGAIDVTTPAGQAESADTFTFDVTHDNGLGQQYYAPDALQTFSQADAHLAAHAWDGSGTMSDVTCGGEDATAMVSDIEAAVWVYGAGSLQGHVFLNTSNTTPTCPVDTDPAWN